MYIPIYTEKEISTHSSILAWRIPWTEEPGRLHGSANSQTYLSLPMPVYMKSIKMNIKQYLKL